MKESKDNVFHKRWKLCTDREEMFADREIITDKISKYMTANGYVLSPKSKNYHALDSFVYAALKYMGEDAAVECQ